MNATTPVKSINIKKWLWVVVIAIVSVLIVFFAVLASRPITIKAATTDSITKPATWGKNSVYTEFQNTGILKEYAGNEPLDCLLCHKQTLSYHDKLGEGNAACWTCHVSADPNMSTLHLSDGTPISLQDSPQLCGQCHQSRYSAWLEGTHGIPGTVAVIKCTACHNPHQPQVVIPDPKPQPQPLDSTMKLPRDAAIITGISVVLLLGLAVFSKRGENQ